MSETMHEMTHSVMDGGVTEKFSLTWEQISEMVASGLCTVGSHTESHPGLTRLTLEKVEEELMSSKSMIENKIPGQIVCHFSYPHSMCNVDVEAAVKKAGYESAVLGYGGKIRKGDSMFRQSKFLGDMERTLLSMMNLTDSSSLHSSFLLSELMLSSAIE